MAGENFRSKEKKYGLHKEIADLLTGVEGFINIVGSDGKTIKDKAIIEKALGFTRLRLIDRQGQAYPASPNGHGYFHGGRGPGLARGSFSAKCGQKTQSSGTPPASADKVKKK